MESQLIAADEEELFRKYYSKLLKTIQIDNLLPDLYSSRVITFAQKQSCGYNEVGSPLNRVKKLLDDVIHRSLGTGCSLFDKLLYAMENSQDRLSKQLAEEILTEKYPLRPTRSKLTYSYS